MSDTNPETEVTQQPKKKKHIIRNIMIVESVILGLLFVVVVVDMGGAKNFDKHFEAALSLYQSNDYDNALSELNKVLNPSSITYMATADGYLLRADIYLNQGKNQLAIDDYSQALKIDTKQTNKWPSITLKQRDERAYAKRGWAYTQIGEYDLALSDATKALEINPDNTTAAAVMEFLTGR